MASSAITGPILSDVRRSPSGSAAAPSWSFADATGTGVYLASTDVLALSTAGVQRVVVDAAGNVGIGTDSPAILSFRTLNIAGNSSGSLFRLSSPSVLGSVVANESLESFNIATETAHPIRFYTNGAERMHLAASGNVGIGTDSPSSLGGSITTVELKGKLPSRGGGIRMSSSDSSISAGLYAADSVIYMGSFSSHQIDFVTQNVTRMRVSAVGDVLVNTGLIGSVGTYNTATGSGANVHVLSNGYMLRSTSSLKYKKEIKNATHGLADLLKLRSVTYENKSDIDKGQVFGGLIAEEVHDAGMTEFVQYAEDGSPDAISYGNMVSLCIKAIQEQQAQIEALKAEVAALKAP